jgi:hypothetical protein
VNGEIVPSERSLRMSDADRERVLARLNVAVGEGRITLAEFEERVAGVLEARTYGEVEPYLADLPMTTAATMPGGTLAAGRDVVEFRNHASTLKRSGRWAVPKRLVVESKAGSVKLDFRHASIAYPVIHIDLDVYAGSTTLILPPGATADIDAVEMYAGSARSKVPSVADNAGGLPHFIVTGKHRAGSVNVRYERRFLRWRW